MVVSWFVIIGLLVLCVYKKFIKSLKTKHYIFISILLLTCLLGLYFLTILSWFDRGDKAYKLKLYDEAIECYTKQIQLTPEGANAYKTRGIAYYNKKEYDKAIEDFNKAIELAPKYADAYNSRGWTYYKKDNYDKAIYDFNKAIELDPKNAVAYNNRGSAYYSKKEYGKAINDHNKAIELDPKDADTYNSRGWIYLWLNEWEKAKNDFVKAIELDNKYSSPYGNIGIYYWKAQKNKQKALEYYEKSFQIGYNWNALYDDTSDGHFIGDLNQTPEFKALVEKYKKSSGK